MLRLATRLWMPHGRRQHVEDSELSTLRRRLLALLGVTDSMLPRGASSSGETAATHLPPGKTPSENKEGTP